MKSEFYFKTANVITKSFIFKSTQKYKVFNYPYTLVCCLNSSIIIFKSIFLYVQPILPIRYANNYLIKQLIFEMVYTQINA